MRAILILLSLFAVAFSGCVGEDAAPADATEVAPAVEPEMPAGPKGYEIDPETANASVLEGAHEHDAWGTLLELTVIDRTIETGDCATTSKSALLLLESVRGSQEAHYGCAYFRLDDGVIIPEGTERLDIAMDASGLATHQGGIELWYRNSQTPNKVLVESTTEAVYTFSISMTREEWDVPHAEESEWFFELRPSGQAAAMDGPIDIFGVAHRVENWIPILGSRHIDHWAPDAPHTFITPDIQLLMDETVSMKAPSYLSTVGGQEGEHSFDMSDIVPPGTSIVSVVVQYAEIGGCEPPFGCWVVPKLQPAKSSVHYGGEEVARGATYGIYTFAVPEPIVPDSTYAKESTYSVWLDMMACPNGEDSTVNGRIDECLGDTANDLTADVRVEVEAWRTAFNMNGLKGRVGV